MNHTYVKSVLSLSNLAAQRGAVVEIPETIMFERQKRLEEYARVAVGFRKFYFALGAIAKVQDEDDFNSSVEPICARDVVSDGVRRLFKLDKALNVPRGAPGRLSTVFGSLASAVDQWNAAIIAEEKATRAAALRESQREAKAEAEENELPIVLALVAGGYMQHGARLTKKVLCNMFAINTQLLSELKLTFASSRSKMVEYLVQRSQNGAIKVNPGSTMQNE